MTHDPCCSLFMVTSIHIIQKNTKTKFRNKIEGNTQDSRLHKCQTSPKPGKSSWSVKKSEKKRKEKLFKGRIWLWHNVKAISILLLKKLLHQKILLAIGSYILMILLLMKYTINIFSTDFQTWSYLRSNFIRSI